MFEEFKKFAMRGNVLDLAVGVIKGDRTVDTLAAAKAAKDVTINYGLFINAVINFLIIAFVLFLMLRQLNKLVAPKPSTEAAPPPTEEILLLRQIRDALNKRP